jgi:hypothetical protein
MRGAITLIYFAAILLVFVPSTLGHSQSVEIVSSGPASVAVVALNPQPVSVVKLQIPDKEEWLEEFSVEVKNLTKTPIAKLHFALVLPEIDTEIRIIKPVFPLLFGYEPDSTAVLGPGESTALRMNPHLYVAFGESFRRERWKYPTTGRLLFQSARFQDRSGWFLDKPISRKGDR